MKRKKEKELHRNVIGVMVCAPGNRGGDSRVFPSCHLLYAVTVDDGQRITSRIERGRSIRVVHGPGEPLDSPWMRPELRGPIMAAGELLGYLQQELEHAAYLTSSKKKAVRVRKK